MFQLILRHNLANRIGVSTVTLVWVWKWKTQPKLKISQHKLSQVDNIKLGNEQSYNLHNKKSFIN